MRLLFLCIFFFANKQPPEGRCCCDRVGAYTAWRASRLSWSACSHPRWSKQCARVISGNEQPAEQAPVKSRARDRDVAAASAAHTCDAYRCCGGLNANRAADCPAHIAAHRATTCVLVPFKQTRLSVNQWHQAHPAATGTFLNLAPF